MVSTDVHWIAEPYDAPKLSILLKDKSLSLSEVKGKVVLLDFWATWCGPCVESVPQIEEMQQKYKSKGLEVWGVAMEVDGGTHIAEFAEQHSLSYKLGMPSDIKSAHDFKADEIPKVMLIDKKGKVRWEAVGFAPGGHDELGSAIDKLLKE